MANSSQRSVCKKADLKAIEGPDGIYRTTMAYNDETMLCHFTMTKGASIPLHNHPAAQNGYIVSGRVRFLKEDGSSLVAEPGTGYAFGPNETHGAEVLEDAEVIECFAPMRAEYADN